MRHVPRLQFQRRREVRLILQTEAAECGLACLGMVASYYRFDLDLASLRRLYRTSSGGSTVRQLLDWAKRIGLAGRPLRVELEALRKLRRPAILHWDMNHFVVLEQVTHSHLRIVDPGRGRLRLRLGECSQHFTGVALELTPLPEFEPRAQRMQLPLSGFWSRAQGLKRSLLQLTVTALLLQLSVLAGPFYVQGVVDEAIVLHNAEFVLMLALGFLLLALFTAATSWLRSMVVIHLGTTLSAQMALGLFRHLLRLPLDFFERRNLGDLVSRFGSLRPIQNLLTAGIVSGLVDGVLGVTTLVMMLVLSASLGIVALSLAALLTVTAHFFLLRLREQSSEQITAQAQESATFMETVRAIQTIKSVGREAEREALWQDRLFSRLNRDIHVQQTNALQETLHQLLQGCGHVGIVYLAAKQVLAGEMTLGMMFAFFSYRIQFEQRLSALITQGREIYLSRLHLERLSDIALAAPEESLDVPENPEPIAGRLELLGVHYRYSDSDPWILQGIDLSIEPGEMVVITGPSGHGKSTLLEILLGLLEPLQGRVLVDGKPLKSYGLTNFRRQVGAVTQGDRLLTGSYADNIAFFDPAPNRERVIEAATLAGLHDDIQCLPMQYETLVGDMGTVLSAGQQQRLLLARAFYRKPRIVALDEGTANLDAALEQRINRTLAGLDATVIVVAHRPDVFEHADRVLHFERGQLSDVTRNFRAPGVSEATQMRAAGAAPA